MNEILISGATGFIGGRLAECYLQRARSVCLLVRNESKLPPALKDACQVFEADITQKDGLKGAFQGVDAVIHAAGSLGHWGMSHRQLYKVNVKGALNVLEAATEEGVDRFVHLSAGGVTGPVGIEPADETFIPQPITAYERTKWEGEKRVLELARRENLNLLVLRPTFTYGPGDPHKLSLFKAVKKSRFAFIGNRLSTVHPVYIDDLIAGIDLGLNSQVRGECLIIGGSGPVSKGELIYAIADVLGARRPTITLPLAAAEVMAAGFELAATAFGFTPPLTKSRILALSRNWGYSIARARDMLNYEPQVDLIEGLRRTAAWYREQGWL